MNKVPVLLLITVVILAGTYLFLTQGSKPTTKPNSLETPAITNISSKVDYSAGFAIFTNGTFRIFTAAMYHNLSKDVYIQADNPNIVYVKKKGITWDDFFKTLPFELTKDCLTTGTKQTFCTNDSGKLKFYLNGKIDKNALDAEINNGDQLMVSYGKETDKQIQEQLQQIPVVR